MTMRDYWQSTLRNSRLRVIYMICSLLIVPGCSSWTSNSIPDGNQAPAKSQTTKGTKPDENENVKILRLDQKLDAIVATDTTIEAIASGFTWSEGPLWIEDGNFLLFTDVPKNRIYRWSRKDGLTIFMEPSGAPSNPEIFREPGANGLIKSSQNDHILVANHGQRAITELSLTTRQWKVVTDRFEGKRFNSPNDLVMASDGSLYFTDPPYGLKGLDASPYKEQPVNGVYRLAPNGDVTRLTDLSFPNGVALSPDEATLYVANSDPQAPLIVSYPLLSPSRLGRPSILHNGSQDVAEGKPGLPDGMAIDKDGNIFATAPGGVHIISPDGQLLGKIDTGTANANCTIGENGQALYIAAHHRILRIALRGNQ